MFSGSWGNRRKGEEGWGPVHAGQQSAQGSHRPPVSPTRVAHLKLDRTSVLCAIALAQQNVEHAPGSCPHGLGALCNLVQDESDYHVGVKGHTGVGRRIHLGEDLRRFERERESEKCVFERASTQARLCPSLPHRRPTLQSQLASPSILNAASRLSPASSSNVPPRTLKYPDAMRTSLE